MQKLFNGTRRHFLQLGLTALACGVVRPAFAVMPSPKGVRALSFHNMHTDERLHVNYWHDGAYDRMAWGKINYILRDHYSGDIHPMNIRLMDLLYDLQSRLKNHGVIEVVSGYRSPKTNLMLARLSDGVAKNSYHCKGMAIDIRLPSSPLSSVYDVALAMRKGGVGYYPDSEFVHVDVGPVRTW